MPHRPTDLALSLEGHFKLSDKLWNLPLGSLACLFFSLFFFLLDDDFLKACLCSRGFLEVSILESHLQRLPVNLTFFSIV